MTELESKIWDTVHKWCDGQYNKIPDQNRRYLMDEIKALVLSNVVLPEGKLCDHKFKDLKFIRDRQIVCKCGDRFSY